MLSSHTAKPLQGIGGHKLSSPGRIPLVQHMDAHFTLYIYIVSKFIICYDLVHILPSIDLVSQQLLVHKISFFAGHTLHSCLTLSHIHNMEAIVVIGLLKY